MLVILGRSLGSVTRIVSLGLLSWFGCPLRSGPCSFSCLVLVRGTSVSRMIVLFFLLLSPLSGRDKDQVTGHMHTHTHWDGQGGLLFCVHLAAFIFAWYCFCSSRFCVIMPHSSPLWLAQEIKGDPFRRPLLNDSLRT